MKIKLALIGLVAGLLVGCGGVGGVGGGGNPNDINLAQAIANGDIPDYNASRNGTPQVSQNYLAVINYLRSLNITCNDASAISGPSSLDMAWNTHLEASAKEHSEDMNKSVWYSHDGSGTVNDKTAQDLGLGRGSYFKDRIDHNGFIGSMKAENIAMSAASFVRSDDYWLNVMERWMASTHGHCSNIMHPSLTQFGMYESRAGVDANGTYKVYWTQDFGGS